MKHFIISTLIYMVVVIGGAALIAAAMGDRLHFGVIIPIGLCCGLVFATGTARHGRKKPQ